jgi:hypothetical protein
MQQHLQQPPCRPIRLTHPPRPGPAAHQPAPAIWWRWRPGRPSPPGTGSCLPAPRIAAGRPAGRDQGTDSFANVCHAAGFIACFTVQHSTGSRTIRTPVEPRLWGVHGQLPSHLRAREAVQGIGGQLERPLAPVQHRTAGRVGGLRQLSARGGPVDAAQRISWRGRSRKALYAAAGRVFAMGCVPFPGAGGRRGTNNSLFGPAQWRQRCWA